MKKDEFLQKWYSDPAFKWDMKLKGIRVIGGNVVFLNPDGSIKAISGEKDK